MKYEQTHPWIRFGTSLPLDSRYSPVWYLLGQVESKIRHLGTTPVSPEVHQRLNMLYLLKGVRATTAIEGNTLTEEEVAGIVNGSLQMPKSKQYQQQEVQNVRDACNLIVNDVCVAETPVQLTAGYICRLNELVLRDMEMKDGICPGRVRGFSVVVGNVYRGAPADECAQLLGMLCDWLSSPAFTAPPDKMMSMAVIKAVIAHIYLAWIHPFGDGNGRTARLVELFILLAAKVPVPAAHLLSNHYNKTRDQYYERLASLSRPVNGALPSLDSFLEYALQGLVDGLQEQLQRINDYQLAITWKSVVYERFSGIGGSTAKRKRELLLSLGFAPARIASFTDIAPGLFYEYYRGKTVRALMRDLAELQELGLLLRTPEGYRPRYELLQHMLPTKAE